MAASASNLQSRANCSLHSKTAGCSRRPDYILERFSQIAVKLIMMIVLSAWSTIKGWDDVRRGNSFSTKLKRRNNTSDGFGII